MNAGEVTKTGWLRIRSGPGKGYATVGYKYPGNAINFDAYENNGGWAGDASMPGGGSSRWYKIAGTNNWMSALYIDNTPERAEEERRRQEQIRQAEEAARRAEEEARRAEEAARRAEEELRQLEEEARRQAEEQARRRQQLLQAAIKQTSDQFGNLGQLTRTYTSNGGTVYEFERGQLFVQTDGNYTFSQNNLGQELIENYEAQYEVAETVKDVGDAINNDVVSPQGFFKTLDKLSPIAKFVPIELIIDSSIATREFFINGKGRFLNEKLFQPVVKYLDDDLIKIGGKSVLKRGPGLDIIFTAGDLLTAENDAEKRRAEVKARVALLFAGIGGLKGAVAGGGVGAVAGGVGAIPGAVVGGAAGAVAGATKAIAIVDGIYLGADLLGLGDELDTEIANGYKFVGDAFNATNSAIEAAKQKAAEAKQKAQELANQARAAYESAKVNVQQAKAAYQTFKVEVQKATTQIVQQSQQKIKEAAQKVMNTVAQNPIVKAGSKVINHVANYAKKAVNTVGKVINAGKQIVNNVIETGKQIINKVIEQGKQAYENLKNVVTEKVEQGKQFVAETYNKVAESVNTVKDTISNGFNGVKSLFGW